MSIRFVPFAQWMGDTWMDLSCRKLRKDAENMMDQIERFINALTDMDWGWWPVLSLRPQKDRDIENQTLVKLTLVFGSIVGLIFLLIVLTTTGTITLGNFLVSVALGWLLYFVVYKITFAYFWNCRARRLRGE